MWRMCAWLYIVAHQSRGSYGPGVNSVPGSAGRALFSMINEFHLVSSKSDCAVPCCYLFMFSTKKFM